MWIRFVRFSTALSFLATAAALIRVSLRVRRGRSYRKQSDGDARGDGALQSTVLGRSRFPSSTPILRFTGSILLRNGRLSDMLSELQQELVKGLEKSAEKAGVDPEHADAVASQVLGFHFFGCSNECQVRRLAMEIRQLASARPITVLNGNSGSGALSVVVILSAF
ncbi:hypothetical protein BHE74_00046442 [Ensete ventricosum]|nr:hypothetical protein GW17_00018030 [Ensete ventricosum]RWW47552.1 hypothetical protein BHE74_00046442 [Ensete ventricosum]